MSGRAIERSGWVVAAAGLASLALLTLALTRSSGSETLPPTGPNEPDLPNVVLIIIDTLRADRVGAYGYGAPTSPELDAYARRGVRFGRVIAQCTWTRPSIGSMLTARYPRTLGLYREKDEILHDRFVTLAEVLKQNGYWTAGATANPNINSYFNFDQGFDEYVDSEVLFPFMPTPAGKEPQAPDARLPSARSLFDALADSALENKGRRPAYLQVNLMEVHEFDLLTGLTGGPYDVLARGEPRPRYLRYLKAVRLVSLETERFIRRLSQQPGWEDTLFVIVSDHGEALTVDHPALARPRWHGYLVYETQALVPWLMFDTSGRLPTGRVVERTVRLMDLMPTVLAYVGLESPDEIEGTSLMPLLSDPSADVEIPNGIVVETRFREADKAAVYANRWIYVENRDGHPGTKPREVQQVGVAANGARTDLSRRRPRIAQKFAAYLEAWNRDHPPAPPVMADGDAPAATLEQLRALGYVD